MYLEATKISRENLVRIEEWSHGIGAVYCLPKNWGERQSAGKKKGALNPQKRNLDGNQGSRNKSAVALFKENARNEHDSAPLRDITSYHAAYKTVNVKKNNTPSSNIIRNKSFILKK